MNKLIARYINSHEYLMYLLLPFIIYSLSQHNLGFRLKDKNIYVLHFIANKYSISCKHNIIPSFIQILETIYGYGRKYLKFPISKNDLKKIKQI